MTTKQNEQSQEPEPLKEDKEVHAEAEVKAADSESQADSVPQSEEGNAESEKGDDALVELQEENENLKESITRLQAEMENTRRRSRQEVEKARKFGMEKLLEDLLPILDSMELGIQSIEEHSDDVEKAKEGYEMISSMFKNVMEKSGITVIDPQGEAFDPEFHQAMTTEPSNEVSPNHVLRVFQKGYRLSERLVRPAMVVISVAPSKEKEDK